MVCCIPAKHPSFGGTVPLLGTLSLCPLSVTNVPLSWHSNADTERVFSIVRKIATDLIGQIWNQVQSACKLSSDSDCFKLDTQAILIDKSKVKHS